MRVWIPTLILSFLSIPLSLATTTVKSVAKGSVGTTGSTFYYMHSGAGFNLMDTRAGYGAVDATAASSGGTSGALAFEVTTDHELSTNSNLVLVAGVSTDGSTYYPIPILSNSPVYSTTSVKCTTAAGCGLGATVSTDSAKTVYLFPASICEDFVGSGSAALGACTALSGTFRTSGTFTLTVKFFILEDADTSSADVSLSSAISTSVDSATITLRFSDLYPEYSSCPSDGVLASSYFPGDTEINLSTTAVSTNVVTNGSSSILSNAAPLEEVIILANETAQNGTVPDASTYNSGSFSIIGRAPLGGDKKIGGFLNSGNGTQHYYQLGFLVRDASGALAVPSAGCGIKNVRTADIQGFLKKSKCFVATAAFRSMDAEPVVMLRSFRDQFLMKSAWGRKFVELYYHYSEPAALWLVENPIFRYPVLKLLVPIQVLAWFILHPYFFLAVIFTGLVASGFFLHWMSRLKVFQDDRGSLVVPYNFVQKFFLLGWGISFFAGVSARAEDGSYIDYLKSKMPAPSEGSEGSSGYTEKLKEGLEPKDNTGYIEYLKQKNEGTSEAQKAEGYSEKLRRELTPAKDESAILAVKEGRSELQFKKQGEIKAAFGFRYGASVARNFSANAENGRLGFDRVYGSGHNPDLQLFSEYQLFHHRYLGSLGLYVSFGASYHNAYGVFAETLTNHVGEAFPGRSRTRFQFFTFPVVAAATYRFNLPQIIVPTVTVGPAIVGYYEGRDDQKSGNRGYSRGYYFAGGAMIPLNWLSRDSDSELYYNFGVKRYSLSIEYCRLTTFSGEGVSLDSSGVFAGLVFEY